MVDLVGGIVLMPMELVDLGGRILKPIKLVDVLGGRALGVMELVDGLQGKVLRLTVLVDLLGGGILRAMYSIIHNPPLLHFHKIPRIVERDIWFRLFFPNPEYEFRPMSVA